MATAWAATTKYTATNEVLRVAGVYEAVIANIGVDPVKDSGTNWKFLKVEPSPSSSEATSAEVKAEQSRAEAAEALKLAKAENLTDVASATTSRTNLGLGTAATKAETAFDKANAAKEAKEEEQSRAETAEATKLGKSENLSGLTSTSTARTNLELGTAATKSEGTFVTVAGEQTVTGKKTFSTTTTEAAAFKTSAVNFHAMAVKTDAVSGTGSAANFTSANSIASTVQITGIEATKGSLKISHENPGPEAKSDEGASAISLDLQNGGIAGSKAQGVFMTKTTYDKFTDGETTLNSKVFKSASAAFVASTDVGLELKGISALNIEAGTTIAKVESATEVELSTKAKESKAALSFELGRGAGPYINIRNTEKKLLYRILGTGTVLYGEQQEKPAKPESGQIVLANVKGKLTAYNAAGEEKVIL